MMGWRGMLVRVVCTVALGVMTSMACAQEALGTGETPRPAVSSSRMATQAAVVIQPRAFGYVIGDLITQRVLLEIDGRDFELAAMPRVERVDTWLERRPARIESASDGRRWLIVDYQLINAPQTLTTIAIPAWQLAPKAKGPVLTIAAWPMSVNALTPETTERQGGLQELRPDRPAPLIPVEPIRRQVLVWSTLLALTLLAWVGWVVWRNRRAAFNLPFARALRRMRRLDDSAPEAWQALHEAFDRTAGRVMQIATLPQLFQRAPHFTPLRPRIEQFFAQSSDLFFGAGLPAQRISVHELCGELRRVERRHEQ